MTGRSAPDDALPTDVDPGAVRRMRLAARLLDDAVRVPGTNVRFGLDPLLGLLPVSGDVVGAALSLYVIFESARQGVSRGTLVRMLANVAVDFLGGSVPILGDAFDVVWRANRRNLDLALSDLGVE
jgi:hypothetical protein